MRLVEDIEVEVHMLLMEKVCNGEDLAIHYNFTNIWTYIFHLIPPI